MTRPDFQRMLRDCAGWENAEPSSGYKLVPCWEKKQPTLLRLMDFLEKYNVDLLNFCIQWHQTQQTGFSKIYIQIFAVILAEFERDTLTEDELQIIMMELGRKTVAGLVAIPLWDFTTQ